MRFNLVNHIIKKIAVPDSKLPINGNEYLGPVRSNVNYNYRPAQVLKMEKQKFSRPHSYRGPRALLPQSHPFPSQHRPRKPPGLW